MKWWNVRSESIGILAACHRQSRRVKAGRLVQRRDEEGKQCCGGVGRG